MFLNLILVS